MKHLTITYDGLDLFDGDVFGMTWEEDEGEVSVTGRITTKPGLAQQLAAVAQRRQNALDGRRLNDTSEVGPQGPQ